MLASFKICYGLMMSPNRAMFFTMLHKTVSGKDFMEARQKQPGRGGRPRKFDENEALEKMQRWLWLTGSSSVSLDGLARSGGLNRPSLAATFGGRRDIYAKAAQRYGAAMDVLMREALSDADLETALTKAFDAVIAIYTAEGPDGCFILCTAPAEAPTDRIYRDILDRSLEAIDALFLDRLEREAVRAPSNDLSLLAAQLGGTLHSIALRARAGWSPDKLRSIAADMIERLLAPRRGTPAR